MAVAKAEMLQSPSSIWTNDDANDTSSLSSGSGRFKAKDFLSKTVSKLPFDVIVISRFCEQVYLSSVSRFIRFVIILLAVAVMVYEVYRVNSVMVFISLCLRYLFVLRLLAYPWMIHLALKTNSLFS